MRMLQSLGLDTVRLSWPLRAAIPAEYRQRFRRTRGGFLCLQGLFRYVRTRIVETPKGWKITVCGSPARMVHGHNRIPLSSSEALEAAWRMVLRAMEAFPFLTAPDLLEVKVQRLDLAMATAIPYTNAVAEGILRASARVGGRRPRLWRGRRSSTYYSHDLTESRGEAYCALCVYGKPIGSSWRGPRFLRIEVRFYSGVLGRRLPPEHRTLDRLAPLAETLAPFAIQALQREFRFIRPIEVGDLRQAVAKLGNRGPREGRALLKGSTIDFVWLAQEAGPLRMIEDGLYDLEETKGFLNLLSVLRIGLGDPEVPELAMFANVLGV